MYRTSTRCLPSTFDVNIRSSAATPRRTLVLGLALAEHFSGQGLEPNRPLMLGFAALDISVGHLFRWVDAASS